MEVKIRPEKPAVSATLKKIDTSLRTKELGGGGVYSAKNLYVKYEAHSRES